MAPTSKRVRKRANRQAGRARRVEAARVDRTRRLAIAGFVVAAVLLSLSVLFSALGVGGP